MNEERLQDRIEKVNLGNLDNEIVRLPNQECTGLGASFGFANFQLYKYCNLFTCSNPHGLIRCKLGFLLFYRLLCRSDTIMEL